MNKMLRAWFLFILRISAWIENDTKPRPCSWLSQCYWFVCYSEPRSSSIWTIGRWLDIDYPSLLLAEVFPQCYNADVHYKGPNAIDNACYFPSEIREILRNIPTSVSPSIKQRLIDADTKLSDYYYKYDEFPFYILGLLVSNLFCSNLVVLTVFWYLILASLMVEWSLRRFTGRLSRIIKDKSVRILREAL